MASDDRERAWEESLRAGYRREVPGERAAHGRTLERLAREPAPRRSRGLAWWWAPGGVVLRPATALAALLVVAAGGLWIGRATVIRRAIASRTPEISATGDPTVAVSAAPDAVPVTFVFDAPGAAMVSLVGDFNGWDPHATPLHRSAAGGRWTAEVRLDRGLHQYGYVIDDHVWAVDPAAPLAPDRVYGTRKSVIVVGEDRIL
jgi:hypothetical protein